MAKLVETPMTELLGTPSHKGSGGGVYDGEPGLPKRSNTDTGVPEKTYEPFKPKAEK